jgi:hypothetical protein
MSQAQFAEHLEDMAHTIVEPSAADLLEVAKTFQAKRNVDFSQAVRLDSGDVELSYAETTTAKVGTKGHIEVPSVFTLALNAIRDAVVDSFRAVPLWQFRQGLVAAGLIPADVQIQAVERKPVHSEPGIEMEWDEDVEAMRVDGIGWDLSFGCKVSFAYDHVKGEHYVCVSTSDADQRAGVTSRRTTKEQLASLGQQLLNVFGEPDPRDAELRGLADELHAIEDNGPCGLPEVTIAHVRTLINCIASTSAEYRAECVRLGAENATVKADMERANEQAIKATNERNETREEWELAAAEVTRLRARFEEIAELVGVPAQQQEAVRSAVERYLFELDQRRGERDEARSERDRLRQALDGARAKLSTEYWQLRSKRVEAERDDLRRRLELIAQQTLDFDAAAEPRRWVAGDAEPVCGVGNGDYSELRCQRAAGHWGLHEDPDQGATWPHEIAKPAEPRRFYAHSPEPEVGTVVGLPDRKPGGPTWTRHPAGGWQRSNSPGYRMAWKSLFGDCGELVEVMSTCA